MDTKNIESCPADDLAWRAFCYLHGELTADEAETFEEELAVEQSAREALAQAVELSGAIEAAAACEKSAASGYGTHSPPMTCVPTTLGGRPAWWRRLSRPQLAIGTAVAACLVVAVTLGVAGRFWPRDRVVPGPDSGNGQAAVAEAWAQIGGHEIGNHDDEHGQPLVAEAPMAPHEHDPESAPDEDRADEHEEGAGVPSVPSWMLAAVDLKSESREMK